jgi:hypothetical protein
MRTFLSRAAREDPDRVSYGPTGDKL